LGKVLKGRVVAIVPAFNEEEHLGKVLEALNKAKKQGVIDEIVVVNDGSGDRTREMAEAAGVDRVINFSRNRGKGAAVLAGLLHANRSGAEAVVMADADILNPSPEKFELLLQPLKREETGMVIGKREDGQVQYSGERALKMSKMRKFIVNRQARNMMRGSRYGVELLLNYAFGLAGRRELDIYAPGASPKVEVVSLGTKLRASQIKMKTRRGEEMADQLEVMLTRLNRRAILQKFLFALPFRDALKMWKDVRREHGFEDNKRKIK